jgi:uncharacterized protein
VIVAVAIVLAIPIAAGLVLGARLFLRQDRIIFRPGPVLDHTPATVGLDHEELRLEIGDGERVAAWWVPATGSGSVVVYFHGSDGNLTHEVPVVRFLHALGVDALLVEYAGYGRDARRPSEASCYRTADAAWRHVTEERGLAEERVILFGHSIGAAVAARTAAERSCGGLVLQGGFSSLRELAARIYPYVPVRPFLRSRFDAEASVRAVRAPVLVVHSLNDEHVPFDHATRLYAAAPPPKKLVSLRGSHFGHAWIKSAPIHAAWHELLARDFRAWKEPAGAA